MSENEFPEGNPHIEQSLRALQAARLNSVENDIMGPTMVLICAHGEDKIMGVNQMSPAIMDAPDGMKAVIGACRKMLDENEGKIESFVLAIDSFSNKEDCPKEYLDLLMDQVIAVHELPLSWQTSVLMYVYKVYSEWGEPLKGMARQAYEIVDGDVKWGPVEFLPRDTLTINNAGISELLD